MSSSSVLSGRLPGDHPEFIMCAYRIYQSSSLQNFIDNYSSILTPDSLFGRSLYLVVQNKSMGEWLKLKLAEKRGVSGDDPYVLPEKALRELAGGYGCVRTLLGEDDSSQAVLYMDNLKIRLYKILEEMFTRGGTVPAVCDELYRYISSFSALNDRNLTQIRSGRLYELADSIAGLFSHYGMNCLPLVEAWEEGVPYSGVSAVLKKHEDWQRFLWDKVFDNGLSLSRILRTVEASNDVYDHEVRRVVLFGSSFLGETALKFFYRLSRDIQVDHFILTPSSLYRKYPAQAQNPLLVSWCTQMDGFAELADSFDLEKSVHDYPMPSEQSALSILQADILEDRTVLDEKIPLSQEDHSLSIHGFTSPWREVEVLKDLILDALNKDETLGLTDIAVLAPDINTYAPFIEALFPSNDSGLYLPFNLIDLNSSEMSPLIQAFLHLFTLPGSKFTRSELFALFDNPCFREGQNINRQDRDDWLQLCEELNIRWGYDREHKAEIYSEASDFNSWERGFMRIREGLFWEEQDAPEILPYASPDEDSKRSRGVLMQVVQNLFNDFYELDRISMPLEQWVLLAESFLESYLKPRKENPGDEQDRYRLKSCFRDMLNLSEETPLPGDREFGFYVFRTLLTEFIRKSSGVKGRYLTQGITCSSLKPMRAIPFRRIYILGMNESDFPGEDEALSFDLKDSVGQTIDLSRRGGDRYAFLETILSAQEHLTLFYKNRDALRGEVLQPSILISELLDYMNRRFDFSPKGAAEDFLIQEESIHNFDSRYFDGTSRSRSFNPQALESASIQVCTESSQEVSYSLIRRDDTVSGDEEDLSLSIDDLLSYLKNPAAWYFRRILKIYPEEEESPEKESGEIRELTYLDRYGYFDRRLKAPGMLGDTSELDSYLKEQQLRGNLPDSDILFLEQERLQQRLNEMGSQAESRHLADELTDLRDLLVDPERLNHLWGHDPLLPQLTAPQLQRKILYQGVLRPVYLSGMLDSLSVSEDGSLWKTLEFCDSGEPVHRHSLKALLKFLVLSSLDDTMKELQLIRIGKRDYPRMVFCGSGDQEAHRVILENPAARLDALVTLCLKTDGEVLPLYPVLGEALAKALVLKPQMSDDELAELWLKQWQKEASNKRGTQTFHRCVYRHHFLKTPPEVDPVALRELLELFYVPLSRADEKGKKSGR
ncbi:exodeoxyribonuclease V subunit gamma [Oceanispirochaeta crateris]|nr:exodeoxyribonuclease V subunit gamma [Oceanispirochaeta crateris]